MITQLSTEYTYKDSDTWLLLAIPLMLYFMIKLMCICQLRSRNHKTVFFEINVFFFWGGEGVEC